MDDDNNLIPMPTGPTRIGTDAVTKIGFYGTTPIEPAAAAVYDRDKDGPLFTINPYTGPDGQPRVSVDLPHQCDEWSAAWGTRDEAIVMLNAFIGAALDALGRLINTDEP